MTNNQLLSAFAAFEPSPHLAVAVSGGADSMALALMAAEWVSERGGRITALTVDHGLREASTAEAVQVAEWLAAHGIEHHILTWENYPTSGNLQQQARNARYALMEEWCRAHGVLHLLTAHHQNDQLETLVQRIQRSSGITGLAGMPMLRETAHLRILRPLLHTQKSALIHYLQTLNQPWIEDPGNASPRFNRNRIRQSLERWPDEEASQALLALGEQMATARQSMEQEIARWLARHVQLYPEGYATIDRAAFTAATQVMAEQVLSAVLTTISSQPYPPRYEKIATLATALRQENCSPRHTLAGCLISRMAAKRTAHLLTVSREPKAMEGRKPYSGGEVVWDGRFCLAITLDRHCEVKPKQSSSHIPYRARGGTGLLRYARNDGNLEISALGATGLKQLRNSGFRLPASGFRPLPATILHTLPTIWRLDELLAVPHINYYAEVFVNNPVSVSFTPAKPLAGAGFYTSISPLQHRKISE